MSDDMPSELDLSKDLDYATKDNQPQEIEVSFRPRLGCGNEFAGSDYGTR
tara:strand:- start:599 stop:748 length:150 start_codon:yes stop_codon:yes gene_type:complete